MQKTFYRVLVVALLCIMLGWSDMLIYSAENGIEYLKIPLFAFERPLHFWWDLYFFTTVGLLLVLIFLSFD